MPPQFLRDKASRVPLEDAQLPDGQDRSSTTKQKTIPSPPQPLGNAQDTQTTAFSSLTKPQDIKSLTIYYEPNIALGTVENKTATVPVLKSKVTHSFKED